METAIRTPIHLWIVGAVSALWNAMGALDYTMTQTRNSAWMSQMSPEQVAWFDTAPMIAHASWAFGVWGAFLGSLLLLARSRYAVWSFILSLAGLAVNTIFQMSKPMPEGPHMDSTAMLLFHGLIWLVAIFLLIYALRMRRAGVLR
jgi:hypothetical protein